MVKQLAAAGAVVVALFAATAGRAAPDGIPEAIIERAEKMINRYAGA
jgi:2-methylcitrate dehydratase PrpD